MQSSIPYKLDKAEVGDWFHFHPTLPNEHREIIAKAINKLVRHFNQKLPNMTGHLNKYVLTQKRKK